MSIKPITKKDGLIISLGRGKDSDSETNENIIITEDFLMISYAISFHEERTLIYNKNTKSHSIIDDFVADLIDKNLIKVYRDYT